MRKIWIIATVSVLVSCSTDPLGFVNAFIGTEYNGHTFPNATYPLGMVQPGPQTGNDGWDYCSGYRYADTVMLGFTQNRLNGTGCADLGDILIMPYSTTVRPDCSSAFDKTTETATPGYYSAYLTDNAVKAEMTCSEHVAFYKFGYDGSDRGIMLDINNITGSYCHVRSADITFPDARTAEGRITTKGWVNRTEYFHIEFSEDFADTTAVKDEAAAAPVHYITFPSGTRTLEVKVALSTVSAEGAAAAVRAEIPHWNFGKTLKQAQRQWRKYLGIASGIKGDADQKTNFYTGLYHMFVQPSNIADVDGRYVGADDSLHVAATGRHYSTLSQWDTFRAADPFYSLFTPDFAGDLAVTMMEQCDEQGFLPIWALCGKENYCMIANHSVPVVADAALNSLPGVDEERAYESIRRSLTTPHEKSDWALYDRFGYLPIESGNESVSRTLEMGYDDWCAAVLAERLGKTEDATFFRKRSQYYRNIFDPSTGLARGKDSLGAWRTPFEPFRYAHDYSRGGDYTEGNAWQYTWHVMQDVPGLIETMGGRDAFVAKLDTLFTLNPSEELTGHLSDVSGLIGQYAHGNEPSHHVAYLYALAGRPDRTAEVVREVFDRFYLAKPDGLCGNDDCGQMSAWYIFSACGFYPVNPVSGEFVLGAPQLASVKLRLPGGKHLTIKAEGLSADAKYVESATLDGKPLENIITRSQILSGGTLTFKMRE